MLHCNIEEENPIPPGYEAGVVLLRAGLDQGDELLGVYDAECGVCLGDVVG